jgi:hypothetical protein
MEHQLEERLFAIDPGAIARLVVVAECAPRAARTDMTSVQWRPRLTAVAGRGAKRYFS